MSAQVEAKASVPQLRFPEFAGAWKCYPVSKVFQFYPTNSLSREHLGVSQSGPFCIHYGDIHTRYPSRFVFSETSVPSVITKTGLKAIENREVCQAGDLIIADASEDYADVGKAIEICEISDEQIYAGLHTIHARPKNQNFAVGYLGYFLQTISWRRNIYFIAQGVKVLSISATNLGRLNINAPSLPEQKKIADFLGAVDDKIAKLTEKKALLERYKKGMMQKLFSQALRFKDENGQDFPDWEKAELRDLAKPRKQTFSGNEVPNVLTNSAVEGVVLQSEYFDNEIANAASFERYTTVETGDFVYNPRISSSAPVGPINRNDLASGIMSPLYTVFRFNCDLSQTQFWKFYFQSTDWHRYMKQVANYGARHDRMAISTSDFWSMPLPFVHPAEQRKIADFLTAIDDKINQVGDELAQAKLFKKGLLQQMFV